MSNPWDGPERRGFPRTSLSVPVHLTVVADVATVHNGSHSGVTRDVSRGGCAVVVGSPIAPHARCIARFPNDTGRLVPDTVWTSVRRVHEEPGGFLVGLEFDSPLDVLKISDIAGGEPREPEQEAKRRILIVDDQPAIRTLLEKFLESRGFEVSTAADGEQAFQSLIEDPPDVLLLDLYLPRLNGYDLLRRLKDLGVSVRLIYTMSGYADTTDAQECLRLGAADHVLKPLDLEALERGIRLRLGALDD